MSDFFGQNFWQSIASGLVITLLSVLLGAKTKTPKTNGKTWKIIFIISWIIFLYGIVKISQSPQDGYFNQVKLGEGIILLLLGLIMNGISKFFIWWHR